MNESEMIRELTKKSVFASQSLARSAVNAYADVIQLALARGEEVILPKLGKLKVIERPERKGRNPKTGETMTIPPKKIIQFKPAKALRDEVG